MGDYNQKPKRCSSDRQDGYSNENQAADPKYVFESAGYKAEWITNEADALLPEFADKMGKYMADNGLTNSKIREGSSFHRTFPSERCTVLTLVVLFQFS